MTSADQDIDVRERKHQARARRARFVGRLLIPVMGLLISASLWSDPRIAAELERGLLVVSQLTGSDDDAHPETAPIVDKNNLPSVSQLPKSRIKVNRLP
ncbi:MAG: hypothetical protein ABJI96_07250 [Paracoccaceae bacterium]